MRLRMRVGAVTLAVVGVAALAVGCSSSTGTPPATAAGSNNALAAYTACLQRNGVTLPSRSPGGFTRSPGASARPRPSGSRGAGGGFGGGGFGGGGFGGFGDQPPAGVDQATWQKAQQACASTRPTFSPGTGGGANNSAFAAYRNCLSEHGVTLAQGQGQNLNTADAKTAAALQACAPLRPTGRPSPPAGS